MKADAGERLLLTLTAVLWLFATVCDLVHLLQPDPLWTQAAFDATALGFLCTLIPALPAAAEFLSGHSRCDPGHPRKRSVAHESHAYWILIALFALNLAIRKLGGSSAVAAPVGLSVVGMTIIVSVLRDSRPSSKPSTNKRAFRQRPALHVVHSAKVT
ncbi:MAG TPA: DUF2231 domain-containing protein [Burkholderiales bacterium]|nr:DUF2231 domain-containing protein [Burkholderiales bacterium]